MKKILNMLGHTRQRCLSEVIGSEAVRKILLDKGYDMDPRHKSYDHVFVMQDGLSEKFLDLHHDVICFERVDGCRLSRRKELKHPNLKHLVKMYMHQDLNRYNAPGIDDRAFVESLCYDKSLLQAQDIILDSESLGKIRQGFSFLHYKMHDKLCEYMLKHPSMPIPERPVDVFFAGTTLYDSGTRPCGRIVTEHRRKCLEAIRSLPFENIVVSENISYPIDEYYSMLSLSKFAVSPWGWGEICHRDYEALMLGCILVRPANPDPMVLSPDIEKAGVFVRPDFSDLEDVLISMPVAKFPVATKMEIAEMVNCRSPERIVDDILMKLLEEGKGNESHKH